MTGSGAGTVITGTLIMAALAYKATDFIKYAVTLVRMLFTPAGNYRQSAVSGAINGILTLLLGCAAGVVIVALMAHTAWSNEIQIGSQRLKELPEIEQLVLGIAITAIASLLFDFKKAVDNGDNASTPKLTPRADEQRHDRLNAQLDQAKPANGIIPPI
jgi:hypothetical protein